jgi:hypothetical protein
MAWRLARPIGGTALHLPPPPCEHARPPRTGTWGLGVVGAKPPRSSPIRPPLGGGVGGGLGGARSSLAMPHTPNTREPAKRLWVGCGLGQILDRYTSYLAIHYAVVAQELRKGHLKLFALGAIARSEKGQGPTLHNVDFDFA